MVGNATLSPPYSTYSPMFLFTQTNRLRVAVVAVVAVPARVRSVEGPAVCFEGAAVCFEEAALLTRPKVEVRSESEGFGG